MHSAPLAAGSFVGAAHTSAGRVRPHNEDCHGFSDELGLYVVCDGMGGHLDGEVASSLAVQTILDHVRSARDEASGVASAVSLLRAAIADANRRVHVAGHDAAHEESRGARQAPMGTTVVALWIVEGHALVAHVGDSRCYRLRGGTLERLTTDHTVVEDARAGEDGKTLDPWFVQMYAHVLTRSIGSEPDCRPDVVVEELAAGDRFLLCTDGLTGLVDDLRIAAILRAAVDPCFAVRPLIDAANERGGHDNITALVAWAASGSASP